VDLHTPSTPRSLASNSAISHFRVSQTYSESVLLSAIQLVSRARHFFPRVMGVAGSAATPTNTGEKGSGSRDYHPASCCITSLRPYTRIILVTEIPYMEIYLRRRKGECPLTQIDREHDSWNDEDVEEPCGLPSGLNSYVTAWTRLASWLATNGGGWCGLMGGFYCCEVINLWDRVYCNSYRQMSVRATGLHWKVIRHNEELVTKSLLQ